MVSLRNDMRTLRTSKLDHRDNGSCVTAGANGSVQRGCLHVDYKTFPTCFVIVGSYAIRNKDHTCLLIRPGENKI